MNKKTKVIITASLAVILFAAVATAAVFVWLRKRPIGALPTKLSANYYIDQAIDPAIRSQFEDAIGSTLAGYEINRLDTRDMADIAILLGKQAGHEQIIEKTIGVPTASLTTPYIVSPQKEPLYSMALSPKLDKARQQLKEVLAAKIKPADSWTLNIAGDIIIGRTVYEQEMRRNDYTSSFHLVKELLGSADYTVADAEWTAADGIAHPLQGMSFSAPEKSLDGLSYAGIDAVSLANNHSMNGGVAAFEQMLASLSRRGIGYFGAGRNFAEAHTPYIANIKGVKVAFLGYTAIPGNYEAGQSSTGNAFVKIEPWYPFTESYVAQVEADIKQAKSQADVVIPYFHWSQEYVHAPNEQMRTLAHRAIDAGATMVVGSHPHWVQGIEWYKDSLIAYSLGNFVFDQEQMMETKQGVVLKTQFENNKLIKAELVPIQIEQYFQPHVLKDPGKQKVLNDIFSNSFWQAR